MGASPRSRAPTCTVVSHQPLAPSPLRMPGQDAATLYRSGGRPMARNVPSAWTLPAIADAAYPPPAPACACASASVAMNCRRICDRSSGGFAVVPLNTRRPDNDDAGASAIAMFSMSCPDNGDLAIAPQVEHGRAPPGPRDGGPPGAPTGAGAGAADDDARADRRYAPGAMFCIVNRPSAPDAALRVDPSRLTRALEWRQRDRDAFRRCCHRAVARLQPRARRAQD